MGWKDDERSWKEGAKMKLVDGLRVDRTQAEYSTGTVGWLNNLGEILVREK